VKLGVSHYYGESTGAHTLSFWRAHEAESIAWTASVIAR
jgi:hypothetical protein